MARFPKGYWARIKRDFIRSEDSLSEFAKKHDLDRSSLSTRVNKEGWYQDRDRYLAKAEEKAIEKGAEAIADKWAKEQKANTGLLAQIMSMIQKTIDKDTGKIEKPMPAADVAKLAAALRNLTANKSFMAGGPTERAEIKTLSLELVKQLEEREREDAEDFTDEA